MRTSSGSPLQRLVLPAGLHLSLLLALALGFLWHAPASAQGAVSLATLQVSLWPEYDQPAVLVILDGQLDPGTTLPASLSVRIPARAGTPHAVAVSGPGGELLTAPYTTEAAGDDIIVLFQAQSLGFRVEYYDPALVVENEARQYAFAWRADHAIAAVAVRVQEPVDARDLAGEPALAPVGPAQDGLDYYQADLGALQPGDTAAVRLSYAKNGSTLTAEALAAGAVPVNPAVPVPETVTPAADSGPLLIAGGAALGLALGAAGVTAYTRSRRAAVASKSGRRARREHPTLRQQPAAAAYCTQCGQGLITGDRFCRNCGARAAS